MTEWFPCHHRLYIPTGYAMVIKSLSHDSLYASSSSSTGTVLSCPSIQWALISIFIINISYNLWPASPPLATGRLKLPALTHHRHNSQSFHILGPIPRWPFRINLTARIVWSVQPWQGYPAVHGRNTYIATNLNSIPTILDCRLDCLKDLDYTKPLTMPQLYFPFKFPGGSATKAIPNSPRKRRAEYTSSTFLYI